jgi:hypothetical protein
MASRCKKSFRERHRDAHQRAALSHDRAAELHQRASEFWNERGDYDREMAERLLAIVHRAHAKEQRLIAATWMPVARLKREERI